MPRLDSTRPRFLWLVLFLSNINPIYNGFACLSNPCLHGVCLDDLNSTYFCYCIDGYTGLQCQTNWNDCWSSPCQNGGVCIDGIASFNCTCPPGFVGDLCEDDFNECGSNPCWNNGSCIDGPNGYLCQCPVGYSGIHCEIDIAVCNITEEARCFNGGVCVEGPGDTFSCRCQPGWDGILCNNEVDECMSAPCQNGGVCIDLHADYECACLFGYTGHNCEEVIQICKESPCKNGALCILEENHSTCYCVPDFHGELCELQYDECQLGPRCLNGGTCIDGIDNFTCSCPPNLTGVLCECLILDNNQLDCTYIVPPTTTTAYANVTMSTVTSGLDTTAEPSSVKPILPSETTTYPGTTTVLIQVPNITLTPTETTTLPWCITPSTKTERPNITTTSATIYSTELSTSTLQTTEIVTSTTVPEIVISTESVEGTTLEGSTVSATTESELTSRTIFTSETEISTTAETTTILPLSPTTTEAEEQTTSTHVTELTETTSTATGTEETLTYSTEHPVYSTSDMSSSERTTVLSTSTELFETTATNIPETSTGIKYTTLPDIEIESSTITATSAEAETSFMTTTESTYTEYSTSSTIPSTISTFFTEEPKEGVVTTTTELTTLSTLPGVSPTKVSTSEGTTVNIVDCTLPDKRCQNGGTCVFIDEAHKCMCPFDAEGPYCEIKLGIKNAAFTGNSYLSHLLPEGRNVSIEFTAKTLSNTGILFYTTLDETYMALYIENGYLVFKFSCGYQTMLLSELNVPVNNGYNMKIKAILEFSKNLTHCEALIKVNDTLTMTGDQTAMINKLLTPSACLHLGNIPNSLTYENIPSGGFIGCMSDLKVHGRNVYIYKDAEDGYEISECSSLACLSNPCKNGASCISSGEKWRCRCKNGFLGNMCELSICDDNPCLYGGTCIPFSSSGYLCLCPYGKHGHFCENDLKITEPYFSSSVRGLSSFIAYPLPEGVSQNMEIRFRIVPTTIDQIALLLFMGQEGQHDAFSDHLAVSFVKGYIMLTWNMGSGPRRIFTSQPIEKGATDYLIQVGYTGRRAWLSVENLGNVTGRSPGNSVQLDIIPFLYLGGHHTRNFSTLPHDLPFHTGFSGCIFDLELRMGTIVLPLQGALRAVGRAVGQCGTTECYDRSCQNGGACLHHGNTFMCLCQDDWYGPLCSSRNNLCDKNITKCSDNSRCVPLLTDYECDCPFGQTGRYCEKNQTLTDLSFTGIRSYVRIHPVIIHNSKFNIEIEIRTLKDTGTILFVGSRDSSFLCLTLQNGLLELNIHSARTRSNSQDHLVVRSSKLLLKGVWHKVQFGVFGRKVYLYVDHIINIGILGHGFTLSIPNSNIFLGGLPDMSQLPISVSSNLPEPFKGCLRHLSVDENIIPLIPENILDSRNVGDCDGTPCGAESCPHGGTCWLDSFLVPHCSCIEPYYGKKCELVSKCSDKTCKNGICQNATCLCRVGFEGGICETEIEVKQPSFTGQSYLIVKKLKDKKRNIRDMELQTLSLNFTTAKNNGLILWTKKNKNFVGIGLENGYLKIVISSNDAKNKFIDIPPYYKVSDGLWHNIELKLLPFLLKIDGKTIKVKVDKNLGLLNVALDGVFFIGGLPSNMSLIKETDGLFHENFDGCVDSFGTNMETLVTDFSRTEGFNINSCIVT